MATVASPIKIGLADRGRAMTLQEFLEAEETDGYRYELARGVLEVSEVADDPHGVVTGNSPDPPRRCLGRGSFPRRAGDRQPCLARLRDDRCGALD
ncbi:MAG: hypothetical protein ACLQIB_04995 [Isosphaeraceae bacterium]